jgi:flagellar biosynthesis protein FlhB
MSEQNDDKSEKASAQKLRKVREKGQVARSRDWATAVGILVCMQLLVLITPGYLEDFRQLFTASFGNFTGEGALDNSGSMLFSTTLLLILKLLLPLFAVPLIVSLASLYPGGWVFSTTPLAPRLERLNPLSYFKRLFKPKHAIDVATSVLKTAVLLAVLYHVARSTAADYLRLQSLPLEQALQSGAGLMVDGVMALCVVFIIFALIDLPVQSLVFLREQRMSKREVKEEHKTGPALGAQGGADRRCGDRQPRALRSGAQVRREARRGTVPGRQGRR